MRKEGFIKVKMKVEFSILVLQVDKNVYVFFTFQAIKMGLLVVEDRLQPPQPPQQQHQQQQKQQQQPQRGGDFRCQRLSLVALGFALSAMAAVLLVRRELGIFHFLDKFVCFFQLRKYSLETRLSLRPNCNCLLQLKSLKHAWGFTFENAIRKRVRIDEI